MEKFVANYIEIRDNIFIHNSLNNTNLEKIQLFRYMDLCKFLSFYQGELYFTSKKELTDQREKGMFYTSKSGYRKIDKLKSFSFLPVCSKPEDEELVKINKELQEKVYTTYNYAFVNCWTQKAHEDFLLWNTYVGKSILGVAVQTSLKKLINAIKSSNDSVFISNIAYYQEDKRAYNIQDAIFAKHQNYQQEKELRLAIIPIEDSHKRKKSLSLKIETELLIDVVHISPLLLDWEQKLLLHLLKQYCSEGIEIKLSNITELNMK